MALNYIKTYTIKDYQKWEGDWELIKGYAYAMNLALPIHQKINLNITK